MSAGARSEGDPHGRTLQPQSQRIEEIETKEARSLADGSRNGLPLNLAPSSLYKDLPLRHRHQEIRLLELLPSSTPIAITCKFHLHSLTDCPPYLALSYTWGTSPACRTILINDSPFLVRENLWAFLVRATNEGISHQLGSNLFWIDAIAINQESTFERNHQVAMMKQIYLQVRMQNSLIVNTLSNLRCKASHVVIWLGPSADDSDIAMDRLNKYVDFSLHHKLYLDGEGPSVRSLLSRAYWERVWIVQEILMARSIKLICGMKTLKWQKLIRHFHDINYALRSYSRNLPLEVAVSQTPAFDVIRLSREYLHFPIGNKGFSLDELLYTFENLKCQDPRDRIYAPLGLVKPSQLGELGIEINYSRSPTSIYAQLLATWCYNRQLSANSVGNFSYRLQKALAIQPSALIDNAAETLPKWWSQNCRRFHKLWPQHHPNNHDARLQTIRQLLDLRGRVNSKFIDHETVKKLKSLVGNPDEWTDREDKRLRKVILSQHFARTMAAWVETGGGRGVHQLQGKALSVSNLELWERMIGALRTDVQSYGKWYQSWSSERAPPVSLRVDLLG